jgi:hypothetical protein
MINPCSFDNIGENMSNLGKKWSCFSCAAKFYDFTKLEILCPKCGANQKLAPVKAKTAKKEKVILQIEDDFAPEGYVDNNNDALEEGLGISVAHVDGVDPGDLQMDDYDE